ncbi:DUF3054 domain-containing protein [Nocardiopsis sp. JB363]|uniref:DUF3054 domain-containing protein n=1 Tax=Nocardiopsis sp. JB363 TaxID=1434837 RepID=UPI00097A4B6F|nr:DUF3054 domain-containing protein [Nocardiopsis sp. JB363]SIO84530.1 PROBABLE CONSERVED TRANSMEMBRANE PROTEIN [Nocardiopsis sp. JB363]
MRSYTPLLALVADLVCVLVFVVVGKTDHATGLTPAAIAGTAWPFVAALVAGWIATLAWRSPARIWPTGVFVWAVTVVGAMPLRLLTGEGAPLSFVLVTSLFLAATMLGWRVVALLVSRRRGRSSDRTVSPKA